MKFQPLCQPLPDGMEGFHSVAPLPAKDTEIIGVTDDIHFFQFAPPQSAALIGAIWRTIFGGAFFDNRVRRYILPLTADPPIQFIQNNVGKQW